MITINITLSNTWGKDVSAFISFPYNQDLIDSIKALPRKFWHNNTKEWEVPFKSLTTLLPKFNNYEAEISIDPSAMAELDSTDDFEFLYKTTPFAHQIEGFKYGMSHNRWLLGDEQGLGKTKQVIDIAVAKKEQRGYKHCLIICGVNGLKWNWVEEVKTHSNESAWIIGQSTKNGKNSTRQVNYDRVAA